MSSESQDVTRLLIAWSDGDRRSADELVPLVYNELRRLAASYLTQERGDHTLQTTALVHEAYMRLVDLRRMRWQDRSHFFAVAAQAMRRLLVDHARRHRASKRGGALRKVSLDDNDQISDGRTPDLVALDDALKALAAVDPLKASIVELRFFGGLSNSETAEIVGCSRSTVVRHWRLAKAWLHSQLLGGLEAP